MAALPASRTCAGVSKPGSPCASAITDRPARAISLARLVIARVIGGFTSITRWLSIVFTFLLLHRGTTRFRLIFERSGSVSAVSLFFEQKGVFPRCYKEGEEDGQHEDDAIGARGGEAAAVDLLEDLD